MDWRRENPDWEGIAHNRMIIPYTKVATTIFNGLPLRNPGGKYLLNGDWAIALIYRSL